MDTIAIGKLLIFILSGYIIVQCVNIIENNELSDKEKEGGVYGSSVIAFIVAMFCSVLDIIMIIGFLLDHLH